MKAKSIVYGLGGSLLIGGLFNRFLKSLDHVFLE